MCEWYKRGTALCPNCIKEVDACLENQGDQYLVHIFCKTCNRELKTPWYTLLTFWQPQKLDEVVKNAIEVFSDEKSMTYQVNGKTRVVSNIEHRI